MAEFGFLLEACRAHLKLRARLGGSVQASSRTTWGMLRQGTFAHLHI